MSEEQKERIWFFNLNQDGDTAIVRLLHSSVDTIESNLTHKIELDGKKKRIKCIGEGCPFCANDSVVDKRIYVHLYDYTDNKEKVWDRTDKIIPEFQKIQESWGALNTAVVKITRKGNEFPKYEVSIQNPTAFADVPNDLVDKPIAKFYALNRKKEDIETFLLTGKFPEKPKYIPKDEYYKQKNAVQSQSVLTTPVVSSIGSVGDDLPF